MNQGALAPAKILPHERKSSGCVTVRDHVRHVHVGGSSANEAATYDEGSDMALLL